MLSRVSKTPACWSDVTGRSLLPSLALGCSFVLFITISVSVITLLLLVTEVKHSTAIQNFFSKSPKYEL